MINNDDPRNLFYNQRNDGAPREAKSENVNPTAEQYAKQAKEKGGGDYESRVAEMKELAKKYEREGEGQLVRDILNNVIEQKAAGKLSNDQLVTFAKRVAPMLNSEQRQRLNDLVDQLLKL